MKFKDWICATCQTHPTGARVSGVALSASMSLPTGASTQPADAHAVPTERSAEPASASGVNLPDGHFVRIPHVAAKRQS